MQERHAFDMLVEWRGKGDATAIGGNGQLFAIEVGLGKEGDLGLNQTQDEDTI